MKKLLLSACAMVVATATFSQLRMAEMPKQDAAKYAANIGITVPVILPSNSATAPSPIWSDDFSDPGNWIINHDQTSCDLDWQIGSNSCTGSYPTADILSTTASNGWAMIDSDAYGGATGGTEVEDCWLTMANPVDLTGYTDVNIEFETNYRSYNSEKAYIVVGIGDGAGNVTWPDLDPNSGTAASNVFAPFDTYASGDATTNPQLMSVNISSALVGLTPTELADIYIRFHWTGTWGYAWFVDDVAIIETPEHELRFGAETFGGWWIGYQSTLGAGTDYTFYPMSQAVAQPYTLEGVIRSTGIQTQNNSTMYVEIDAVGGMITSLSSTPISLSSGQNDTAETTTTFSPTNMGLHNISFWASSDSFPTTPVITRSTIVTDTIYGVDYDWNSDGSSASGYAYLSRQNCGQVLANVFDIYANTTLTSISFHVSSESVAGADVTVELYEDDPAGDPIFLDQSNSYELQLSDIGNWVTISLNAPLLAGTSYLAGVHGVQHPTDTVGISTSGNDHATGYIQDNGCEIGTGGLGAWYPSSARLIRMNFGPVAPPSAINDIKNLQFNVYPNPTNGVFTIELNGNAKYEVTVNNVLGQTVYATSVTSMNTTIDLSSFEKGIYTIELKNSKITYTEKVIVE